MERRIITISREFGSGGRELGKQLSEILKIKYLDNEIVEAVAKETDLDPAYISRSFDSGLTNFKPTFEHSFSSVSVMANSAMLIAKQHNIIKELVKHDDYIIIGRGANAILTDLKPFNIFVYADMQSKIARCKARMCDSEHMSDKELEKKIISIDKGRKRTHDLYSNYAWGDKVGYNLCVNTSNLKIEDIAPIIAQYALNYFNSIK